MQRSARASARKQAAEAAERDINTAATQGLQEQLQLQRQLNERWHRLLANDPDVVFATLTEAFEDNEAPAAVAGIDAGEASILVVAPGIEAVPERMPKLTPAGNLSIAKLTKSVRNSYYLGLVCGHVLVTAREALAVAPGLQAVRIAVARRAPVDAYGTRKVECLLAALFTRQRLQGVRWQSADAIRIVQDASADLRIRLSATHELLPLDLSKEPSLAALLQVIDSDEAGRPSGDDGPGAGGFASPLPDVTAGSRYRANTPTQPIHVEPALAAPTPPPRHRQSARDTRRATKKPLKVAGIAVSAFVLLLIVIGVATGGGKAKQTGNAATVATTTPTRTATPSPTPHAKKRKARPKKTSIPARATTPPPAATAPAVAPSSPAAAAPAGCTPLSNEGTCYEPGEFCRYADHGASGIAGDGEAITCEDNDGWRWEPS